MAKIIHVPIEEHMVEPTQSNKFCIGYFTKSYEKFMGVSTTNVKIKIYTLEQQMERYARNLAYWYIQLETMDENNNLGKYRHIEPKETFITAQIKRLYDIIENIFPPDVIPDVIEMSFDIKNNTLDDARKL